MKRFLAALIVVVLLYGCTSANDGPDRVMGLRQRLQAAEGCRFDVTVTADYGVDVYTFGLSCEADREGNLSFEVTAPESIQGISGTVGRDAGKLTFDDQALAFDLLADGQISPVSAPWIFLHTLLGGYLSAAGSQGELLLVSIDDSYGGESLRADVWLNAEDLPVRGELLWQGRRILTLEVENFSIL